MTTLGQNIVKARIDKRMKQQDLLQRSGLSQRYLSAVENDKVDPRISVVQRIARALEVTVNDLLPQDDHAV